MAPADTTHSTKAEAKRTVNAFWQVLAEILQQGDTLTFVGWGAFSVKPRAARLDRNPATGKAIQILATVISRFKAGTLLKAAAQTKRAKSSKIDSQKKS